MTQYHYLHRTEITDLPGGLVDEEESPEDAARRELAEETGLHATWLHPLGTVASARATSTETAHLFLAHGCTPGLGNPDPGEELETRWSTWNALADTNLMEQPVTKLADGPSRAAVQHAESVLRSIGGLLPGPAADLPAAAWLAFAAIGVRDPIADGQLILAWLDLALGRYAEGAAVLDDLQAALVRGDGEEAWTSAAWRLRDLAQVQ